MSKNALQRSLHDFIVQWFVTLFGFCILWLVHETVALHLNYV